MVVFAASILEGIISLALAVMHEDVHEVFPSLVVLQRALVDDVDHLFGWEESAVCYLVEILQLNNAFHDEVLHVFILDSFREDVDLAQVLEDLMGRVFVLGLAAFGPRKPTEWRRSGLKGVSQLARMSFRMNKGLFT